jgi:hypothetical protein
MRIIGVVSVCCGANVETGSSPDFVGDKEGEGVTACCMCEKCGKPCDTVDLHEREARREYRKMKWAKIEEKAKRTRRGGER